MAKKSNNQNRKRAPQRKQPGPGSGGKREGAGRKLLPNLAPLVEVEIKGTIGETCRAYAAEAIGVLLGVMRDPLAKAASRNAAASKLLDAAAKAPDPKADDDYEVSNIELARWIISVLENAADEQEAQKAKEGGSDAA